MTAPAPVVQPGSQPAVQLRRRQARGLLWIGLAVLTFSILRAGVHRVFAPHWWRLW